MARLNAYSYELSCTKRCMHFFPSGMRSGLIVTIADDNGRFGIAEVAPYLRPYTIADLVASMSDLSAPTLEEALQYDGDRERCASYFKQFSYPVSSVLSAAHFFQISRDRLFSSSPRRSLPLAALIDVKSKNEAIALAQAYLAQGYSCLKIKIGTSIAEELEKIKIIAALGGARVSLRLDANKALSLKDACTLLNGLRRVNIEYIEEPLIDHTQSKSLFLACGVPIALDESVGETVDFSMHQELMASFFIIKPERFSSVYELIQVAERAKACGVTPIFSHCFESEVTSLQSLHLIDELALFDYAHGIVPEGFFKDGLLKRPLRSFRGQLLIDQCPRIEEDSLKGSAFIAQVTRVG